MDQVLIYQPPPDVHRGIKASLRGKPAEVVGHHGHSCLPERRRDTRYSVVVGGFQIAAYGSELLIAVPAQHSPR